MATRTLGSIVRRRSIVGATALVGLTGAFAIGMAPAASAAARTTHPVTVSVTQNGNYVAAICVGDNLEARCVDNVRKGQTQTFNTNPAAGEPVSVNVIVKGGGSTGTTVVTEGSALRFATGGSKAKPVVVQK
jgi:hypothetical protein